MHRLLSVIVAAVALLWCGALGAQSLDGATNPARDSTKDSINSLDLQTDLPKVAKASRDSINSLDLQTELPKQEPEPAPLKIPIPDVVIWLALAGAVALILYAVRDSLPSWLGRNGEEGWEAPAGDAADAAREQAAVDALAAADTLSRSGRFVEAMHMLLLQSLVEIRQQLGAHFADSLTSREILRGVRLPPQGRVSFREIVDAVERTYFGGYPAESADYTACRRSFDSLRLAMRAGAPS
jgi:Domain of unknown function (DUF4129)